MYAKTLFLSIIQVVILCLGYGMVVCSSIFQIHIQPFHTPRYNLTLSSVTNQLVPNLEYSSLVASNLFYGAAKLFRVVKSQ